MIKVPVVKIDNVHISAAKNSGLDDTVRVDVQFASGIVNHDVKLKLIERRGYGGFGDGLIVEVTGKRALKNINNDIVTLTIFPDYGKGEFEAFKVHITIENGEATGARLDCPSNSWIYDIGLKKDKTVYVAERNWSWGMHSNWEQMEVDINGATI